tara:strand:+ start:415 stop:627 length:213 start_codon:yes stop_codon:yes gene_type:complete
MCTLKATMRCDTRGIELLRLFITLGGIWGNMPRTLAVVLHHYYYYHNATQWLSGTLRNAMALAPERYQLG